MGKIHTRRKRKLGLPTHKNPYQTLYRQKKRRPKTFATEEAAHRWAQEKGLSEYFLKKAKKGKRFQICLK